MIKTVNLFWTYITSFQRSYMYLYAVVRYLQSKSNAWKAQLNIYFQWLLFVTENKILNHSDLHRYTDVAERVDSSVQAVRCTQMGLVQTGSCYRHIAKWQSTCLDLSQRPAAFWTSICEIDFLLQESYLLLPPIPCEIIKPITVCQQVVRTSSQIFGAVITKTWSTWPGDACTDIKFCLLIEYKNKRPARLAE